MLASLARLAIWLLLAISIVVVGWNEPLIYLFMSRQQIAEAELPYQPKPKPRPDFHAWKVQPSILDATPPPGKTSQSRNGLHIGR